ncbi:ethylbenzene dehydrogenase-related protein [Magnetovirga frankeli]|uniref:ethylbenzene dehydrogenase-related protein n=1 Tax=Magnetovirga frankeli TaxID=947516 RepID=UPI003D33FAC6
MARKVVFGATLGSAVIFMIIGVILWGGFNWGMEATNTEPFCISCHEMKDNVYNEYVGTIHDANRSGVKATCPDCHVPRPWLHKMKRKIQASNEVLHKILGTVDTPEKFDAHRLTMARRVWKAMKDSDSRECRNCHDWDTMDPSKQQPRARNQHKFAMENGNTCIDCHKGIAHSPAHTQISEEELNEWAKPVAAYKTELPEPFKEGLARAEAAEAKAAEEAQEEAKKEREKRKAEISAQKQRIQDAVEKALTAERARLGAGGDAAAQPQAAVEAARGFGVAWDQVPERMIPLFYPGQTSMEWTLVGKYHGGARPFKMGDRCTTCHEKETADMGAKMVSGDKAETTPIPGKRPGIPVTVQAAHDGDNLYLRFQWEEGEHVAIPFVDGGKMDPENAVKLALMLSTDEVKYAGQSGCWGTCHHDLRNMPEHPEDPSAVAGQLDVSQGITKYIAASRTEIEEKGRRGAVLGGWDKLKDQAEIEAALASGQFMDLLRWNSSGTVENGHVLEQRVMDDKGPLEAQGWLEGGYWTVEIKRPLAASTAGDLPLEAGKLYNFGFAIHDDFSDSRFHHVSLGYRLGLDNPEADVNVVKAEVSAPAAAPVQAAASAAAAAATPEVGAAVDEGIDWDKVDERLVTLFYPGQTSMEWTLVGKYHGGSRPFMMGDRCTTCHDKETADMGAKMVGGDKAETSPIPGKRPGIPVSVQATHDKENLYLRFQWEEGEHVAVPFVDGGKMDPENPVKLALMLSTDEVQYAGQAGCWGTCHHDLRHMPEHPEDPSAVAGQLDVSQGITKYIAASRTEIEEKGRRGAVLGGWDKLKDQAEIEAALASGQFMDLLRWNSSGAVENGHVLEQRVMNDKGPVSAHGTLEGGYWTLVIKRPLAADNPGDLPLEAGKLYNFGFAIHDDFSDSRFHHVSLGYRLGLDNPEAEINVIAQ